MTAKDQPFTIDKVGWHTKSPGNPESLDRIHFRFRAIIIFLQEKGLTTRTILSADELITDAIAISSGDLTESGMTIMRKCYHRWLQQLDKGKSPEDFSIFEKELRKI